MKLSDRAMVAMSLLGIPSYMHEQLRAYFEEHRPVGDFLKAVLENNLVQSYALADENNTIAMRAYASWIYNFAPMDAVGSPENVSAWLAAPVDFEASNP